MSGEIRTDVEAMIDVGRAVRRTVLEATEAMDATLRAATAVVAEIRGRLGQARSRLARAEQALAACQGGEDAECDREAVEVRDAGLQVAAAERALRLAEAALVTFEPARARFTREGGHLRLDAQRKITDRVGDVEAYLAGGGGGGGGGSGGGGGGSSWGGAGGGAGSAGGTAGDTIVIPGGPAEVVLVPIDGIDQSENPITGPGDFTKGYSPQALAWALDALEDVVLPAMAQGRGQDYFQERDGQEGRVGAQSYSDTYSGFFLGNRIKLEVRPDGRYGITNGRHRVWVAEHHGVTHVPAELR